jgi:isopenicillin N synthase-like dioxygenase
MDSVGRFELPALDLSHFLQDGTRQDFAEQLRNSLAQHGFVKIINHGIGESSINQLFDKVSLEFPLVAHTLMWSL